MKKSATEEREWEESADSSPAPTEGPGERLRRVFLRELPMQVELALERWAETVPGNPETQEAVRGQLHRLKGEAAMLRLPAHTHLLAALKEVVASLPAGEPVEERVALAVRVALRAVVQLEGHRLARAEQEAAQLRWLTQDSDEIASGIFPKK